MQNFIQPGDVLTLTAPAGGVVSGTAYKIGQLLVVAAITADAAAAFEGKTTGVFTLPKATAQAFAEGALVYWDNTAKKITTTALGNLLVGVAVAAALAADTTGLIRLDGVARVNS